MTPWSEQVDPNNVLPEYPRPQMVRQQWVNLNGLWDFGNASAMDYNATKTFDKKILVPFPMESAISGVMDTNFAENQGKVFVYRRDFKIPKDMEGQNILLHFGAVDWECDVYVNGKKIGRHTGGFDPFYFDITSALKPGRADQQIEVFVRDEQEFGGYPHGKQKINEKVIWYTPTTGIWQTVWLEPVSKTYIKNLDIVPDIDNKVVNITVNAVDAAPGAKATIEVFDGNKRVSTTKDVELGKPVAIPVKNMKLWSPDTPFLYDMHVEIVDDKKVVDEVDSYFGMRKISLGEQDGMPCIMLNNEYIFQFGVLDQGFWPDGIYTAPTDEALRFDIEKIKEYGMNVSRKHIKVEPARWYYHCDKLGMLVWQDMPCNGFGKDGKLLGTDIGIRDNFHDELGRMIDAYKNHPSIVMWVVYNEGWGQPNAETSQRGVDIARSHDDTRLISIASGWHDSEYGDIKDTHWYSRPNMLPNPANKRASVCGEYGGLTYMVDGHRWQGGSKMVYTTVKDPDELTDTFIEYMNSINGMKANGLCAAIYTQITDVEDEENGLLTYDRKVNKPGEDNVKRIAAATDMLYNSRPRPVVPVTNYYDVKNEWKYYVSEAPLSGDSWAKPSFNDRSWKTGKAGFGRPENNLKVGTRWETPYIYLRRYINFDGLTKEEISKLEVQIFHDEDCVVYINGVKALELEGFVNSYKVVPISDAARATIKPGQPNLIAVSCKQTTGGQFIDLGFYLPDNK